MTKPLKKNKVDRYKIGIQTVSRKDSIVEIPAGAIPLSVNMRVTMLAKNPQTKTFDMGTIDILVYAQKVKGKNKKQKDVKDG